MAFIEAAAQGEHPSSLMPIVAVLMLVGGTVQIGCAIFLWLRPDSIKQASGPRRWRNLFIVWGVPWIFLLPAVVFLIIQMNRSR